jgi:hypothetical protein
MMARQLSGNDFSQASKTAALHKAVRGTYLLRCYGDAAGVAP